MADPLANRVPPLPFSEKSFYLAEFRGRTLALALTAGASAGRTALRAVLEELSENDIRWIVISEDTAALEGLRGADEPVRFAEDWAGSLWSQVRRHRGACLEIPAGSDLAAVAAEVSTRLRLAKLIWLDGRGALLDPTESRIPFIDATKLASMIEQGHHSEIRLLEEIRAMLSAGFPSVTICSIEGLEDELFTYAGSGTFFSRERYADVRWLALDEFEAAHDLIQRGVAEGYLVSRSEEELESILAHAFGVFVEGRFLAGVGALLPHLGDRAGEIASLYTLTRFLGEGVGAHLIRFALGQAQREGWRMVFACTTSPRVVRFFEGHGFREVASSEIPDSKWKGYDSSRRRDVHCLARTLE